MKKKRVLLVSCAVIMLCVCVIAGMSYALFTDSVSVKNHLKAGNLDVTLTRTNLEYCVLDEVGELDVTTVEEDYDFTGRTDENVFGIDSSDIRIVPGSYFDAEMQIANAGNTAFNYRISIRLVQDSALAEQLKVIVTDCEGNEQTAMLTDLASGMEIDTGKMKVGDEPQTFHVRVEFLNDSDYNRELPEETPIEDYMHNNEAQSKLAVFDLVVTATQATTKD